MDIKTIDAAFNTLLATPGVTGDSIALFVDRFYTPVLELYALKFLADRRLPREEKEDLAREAARVIVVDQAAKALSGRFRFQGKSRYSTYLYRAISRALAKETRAASAALSRQRPPAPPGTRDSEGSEFEAAVPDRSGADALRAVLFDRLYECLDQLDETEREFVNQVFLRGLTIKTAGAALGHKNPGYAWKLLMAKLERKARSLGMRELFTAWNRARE